MANAAPRAQGAPKPGDSYVQSFARGLEVIRTFNAQAPQQTLSEVAQRSGLTRAGARRILLIGYDMREINGRKHWHPDHPAPCVQKQQFGEWIHKFRKLAEDLKAAQCEVINCTPKSALQCFPMGDMEQELAK